MLCRFVYSELMNWLRREIGQIVQKDFEFNSALVTIVSVEATQDTKKAKVWVGIVSSANSKDSDIIKLLGRKAGAIQSQLGKRITLRQTPRLNFQLDNSAIRGAEMIDLLDQVNELPQAPQSS